MTSKELITSSPISTLGEQSINSLFCIVAGTSSKLAKEKFLTDHMSETLQMILKDTYGGRKYYVKKYDIYYTGALTIDHNYDIFHTALGDLAERKYTGSAAITYITDIIERYCRRDQIWLARILDGNLRIGAGSTFAEDSGTVEKYPCALANVLEKVKNVDIFDGNWFVSRKLDGCRCHAHVDLDNNTIKFISRQGKEFTTLSNIREPLMSFLSGLSPEGYALVGKWVIDGEMCIVDESGNEDFHELMSVVRRKDFTISNPKYKIFDIMPEEVFYGHAAGVPFGERYELLVALQKQYNGSFVEVVEQEQITSPEVLDRWQMARKAGNWEGLMVRKNVLYEGRRTNNLLKIKPFQDDEYVVKGIIEGDLTYNTEGGTEIIHGVSALTIEHKGNIVKVGTGLSRDQRIRWVGHPEEIIGKTITVQYFEESQDAKTKQYSLRFPVLKYVYDNQRDI